VGVPLAFDAVGLAVLPVALLVNRALVFVDPPLEAVNAAIAVMPDFGKEDRSVFPHASPEVNPSAVDKRIGAD
jgi:hypothetical protein